MKFRIMMGVMVALAGMTVALTYAGDRVAFPLRPHEARVTRLVPVSPALVMPIGVPAPEFGPTYRVPPANRTATAPSLPSTAAPGDVIRVSPGAYTGPQGYIDFSATGTAARPVTLVGSSGNRLASKIWIHDSSYVRLINIDARKVEIGRGCHHIVVQGSRIGGGFIVGPTGSIISGTGGGFSITGTATVPTSHIVFSGVTVENNGNWLAEFDEDIHGGVIGAHSSHVWVMDSTFTRNSGDGIQINAGSRENQSTLHHIYVARNVAHHNKQTGFHTKQATDVIFSQNTVYDQWPIGRSPSAWGGGLGYQYGPERVWFIFNHIHHCAYGISGGSTSGLGNGQSVYVVGNLIHDIRHHPSYPYNPNTSWSNAAVSPVGNPSKTVVHNTMMDCEGGIYLPGGETLDLCQNVFDHVDHRHIWIEDPRHLTTVNVRGNRGSPGFVAQMANSLWTLPPGNRSEENLAVDERGRPYPGSPLKSQGTRHPVYDEYLRLYGLDIYKDFSGKSRSVPTTIGCWE